MHDHERLARPEVLGVLGDGLLRHEITDDRAQHAGADSTLGCPDDRRRQWSDGQHRADAWDEQCRHPGEQAEEPTNPRSCRRASLGDITGGHEPVELHFALQALAVDRNTIRRETRVSQRCLPVPKSRLDAITGRGSFEESGDTPQDRPKSQARCSRARCTTRSSSEVIVA